MTGIHIKHAYLSFTKMPLSTVFAFFDKGRLAGSPQKHERTDGTASNRVALRRDRQTASVLFQFSKSFHF